MYLGIYVHINMYITTMKEKDVINHTFQRHLGGGTWEEKKKGNDVIIMISKFKKLKYKLIFSKLYVVI